jgi:hypothetical protein
MVQKVIENEQLAGSRIRSPLKVAHPTHDCWTRRSGPPLKAHAVAPRAPVDPFETLRKSTRTQTAPSRRTSRCCLPFASVPLHFHETSGGEDAPGSEGGIARKEQEIGDGVENFVQGHHHPAGLRRHRQRVLRYARAALPPLINFMRHAWKVSDGMLRFASQVTRRTGTLHTLSRPAAAAALIHRGMGR